MSKSLRIVVVTLVAAVLFGLIYSSMTSARPADRDNDRVLSKITFVHHRKAYGKPAGVGKPNKPKDEETGYYTYLAKGVKWKGTEPVLLNPNCDENLDSAMVTAAVGAGLGEWENAGGTSLAIFGDLVINETVSYDDGRFRDYNTISFGSYGSANVIGVTTIWGYFTGPPGTREIVEAHILLNDEFVWGDAVADTSLMDVQNIITHELGHWAGMGDLYETAANEETMYGYSAEGEIIKCDLYIGDIEGITKLYR